MAVEWKNTTSYSRGEKKSDESARTWQADVGGVRVVVTRYIHGDKNAWYLNHDGIYSDLASAEIEKAKVEALQILFAHYNAIAKAFAKASGAKERA